jgi:hypothetical protein
VTSPSAGCAATDRAGGGGADREVVLEAAAGGFGEDRLWR